MKFSYGAGKAIPDEEVLRKKKEFSEFHIQASVYLRRLKGSSDIGEQDFPWLKYKAMR
jgi:hypothetical protein